MLRAAATIKASLGVEVHLAEGKPGTFRVLVDGATVLKKGWLFWPTDAAMLAAVGTALKG